MAHRRRRRRRRGKISDATPAQPGANTDDSNSVEDASVSEPDGDNVDNEGGD
jgi:hypothetical protein